MAVRTPHEQGLDYYATTLELFIEEMEEAQLRLIGKALATVCIFILAFTGKTGGDIASVSIGAIWVVTIPSIIEAWVIAKNRQNERMEDYNER